MAKRKEYTSTDIKKALGLLLCLFAVLVMLSPSGHLWGLAYALVFVFGFSGFWILMPFLFLVGLSYFLLGSFPIRKGGSRWIAAFILIFSGISLILSGTGANMNPTISDLSLFIGDSSKGLGYCLDGHLDSLSLMPELGGGIVYYALASLLNMAGSWLVILIAVLLMVIGLIVAFIPQITKLIMKMRAHSAVGKSRRKDEKEQRKALASAEREQKALNELYAKYMSDDEGQESFRENASAEEKIAYQTAPTQISYSRVKQSMSRVENPAIPREVPLKEEEARISYPDPEEYLETGLSPVMFRAPRKESVVQATVAPSAPTPVETAPDSFPMVPDHFEEPSAAPIVPEPAPAPEPVIEPEPEPVAPSFMDLTSEPAGMDKEPEEMPSDPFLSVPSVDEESPAYPAQIIENEPEIPAEPASSSSDFLFEPAEESVPAPAPEPVVTPAPAPAPKPAPEPEPEPMFIPEPPKPFVLPSPDLLATPQPSANAERNQADAENRLEAINGIFQDLSMPCTATGFTVGPSVTRFDILTNKDASVSSVTRYMKDVSIKLGGVSARFEEVVRGKATSGLEIPNAVTDKVYFKDSFEHLPENVDGKRLYIPFGKDISGNFGSGDLAKFPHMLVAGTTGSGKSVFMHGMIMSLIMRNTPEELRLILVDPKRVEMTKYTDIPHLLCPIVKEAGQVKVCLQKLANEMEKRYALFEKNWVQNIIQYNQRVAKDGVPKMSYIVCIIDEFADIKIQSKDVDDVIIRLTSKARAAGIHLIIATQRPSAEIITGPVKANLGVRVALSVSSGLESRIILDEEGAEDLVGYGDMLVSCPELARVGLTRLQGCFVDDGEVMDVTDYLRKQASPVYDPEFLDLIDHEAEAKAAEAAAPKVDQREIKAMNDEAMYEEIKRVVMKREYASASWIQRTYGLGFPRAGKIFSRLEAEGIVESEATAEAFSNKGRRVLVHEDGTEGGGE